MKRDDVSDGGARRLAEAVRRQRGLLRFSQQAIVQQRGGVSLPTLKAVEAGQGRRYQARTLAALDEMLGWFPGHSEALLAGEDWAARPDDDPLEREYGRGVEMMAIAAQAMIKQTLGPARTPRQRAQETLGHLSATLGDDDLELLVSVGRRLAERDRAAPPDVS